MILFVLSFTIRILFFSFILFYKITIRVFLLFFWLLYFKLLFRFVRVKILLNILKMLLWLKLRLLVLRVHLQIIFHLQFLKFCLLSPIFFSFFLFFLFLLEFFPSQRFLLINDLLRRILILRYLHSYGHISNYSPFWNFPHALLADWVIVVVHLIVSIIVLLIVISHSFLLTLLTHFVIEFNIKFKL